MKTTLSDTAKSPWATALAIATPIALGAVGRIAATRFTLPPFLNPSLRSTVVMGVAAGGVTALTQRIFPKGRKGQRPTEGISVNIKPIGNLFTIDRLPRDTTTCGYLTARIAQAMSTPDKTVQVLEIRLVHNNRMLTPNVSLKEANINEKDCIHVVLRCFQQTNPPLVDSQLIRLYEAAFTGGRAEDYDKLIKQLEADPDLPDKELTTTHLEGIKRQFQLIHLPRPMKTTLSDAAKSPWATALAIATPIALGAVGRIAATRFTLPPFLNPSLRSTVVMGAAAGGMTALTQRIFSKGQLPPVAPVTHPRRPTEGVTITVKTENGEFTIPNLPHHTTTVGLLMAEVAQTALDLQMKLRITDFYLLYAAKKLKLTDSLATAGVPSERAVIHLVLCPSDNPAPPLVNDRLTQLYQAAFAGGRAQDNVELTSQIQRLATQTDSETVEEEMSKEQIIGVHLKGIAAQFTLSQP